MTNNISTAIVDNRRISVSDHNDFEQKAIQEDAENIEREIPPRVFDDYTPKVSKFKVLKNKLVLFYRKLKNLRRKK